MHRKPPFYIKKSLHYQAHCLEFQNQILSPQTAELGLGFRVSDCVIVVGYSCVGRSAGDLCLGDFERAGEIFSVPLS